MVLNGKEYFKVAHLKSRTRGELQILRRDLKCFGTVYSFGHKITDSSLNYIEGLLCV